MHVPGTPDDVFGYFTDPARYVQWMGSEADLEPVPAACTACACPTGSRPPGGSSRSPARTRSSSAGGSPAMRRLRGPSTKAACRVRRSFPARTPVAGLVRRGRDARAEGKPLTGLTASPLSPGSWATQDA